MMYVKHLPLVDFYYNGFINVQGWYSEYMFIFLDIAHSLPINKKGGVCEIGIHHGRLFMLLNQFTEANEKSYAIDIFDNQHLNLDNSGCGNLEIFKDNLTKYDRHQGKNTVIIQGDSTDSSLMLTSVIQPGSIKLFSIDGGHTVEHTVNDIMIASQLISNEGIVMVDDIMDTVNFGVIEGVVSYLNNKPSLIPFAIGWNKLFMAKLSYHKYYYDAFKNTEIVQNTTNFFGYDVVNFGQEHFTKPN